MPKPLPQIETAAFAAFWADYPRKVAKRAAICAWARLTPAQRERAQAMIAAHAAYWRAAGRSAETIPHPATWLNGWRFDDELPARVPHGRFNARDYAATARNAALAQELDGGAAAAPAGDLRRPAGQRTH